MQNGANTGEGRVWLVTGTSSGFGRAIARAALSRGDTVVGTARRAERLDDLIREAPEGKAHALSLDLTDTMQDRCVIATAQFITDFKQRSVSLDTQ